MPTYSVLRTRVHSELLRSNSYDKHSETLPRKYLHAGNSLVLSLQGSGAGEVQSKKTNKKNDWDGDQVNYLLLLNLDYLFLNVKSVSRSDKLKT